MYLLLFTVIKHVYELRIWSLLTIRVAFYWTDLAITYDQGKNTLHPGSNYLTLKVQCSATKYAYNCLTLSA